MPHENGGVAHILVALEDAGLGVSRIERRFGDAGVYRVTVNSNAESAAVILEGLGWSVRAVPDPPMLAGSRLPVTAIVAAAHPHYEPNVG